ncbi:unnamed protein product [Notodromas monacha]|uniref:Homeobox domain-containing protein n=1 Tax=Notodromas monacha TaxID=399045 RepID=A0A7R9BNP3_9CRUS|nr:unnamed protein product [Notodromas monacha]CAG0917999.1 unnamed protein product [Notodromas monacha]
MTMTRMEERHDCAVLTLIGVSVAAPRRGITAEMTAVTSAAAAAAAEAAAAASSAGTTTTGAGAGFVGSAGLLHHHHHHPHHHHHHPHHHPHHHIQHPHLPPGALGAAGASLPWAPLNRGKPRRGMMRRAVFSDTQRQGLEQRFQVQKYISKPDRKKLAEKLGLKDSQVRGNFPLIPSAVRLFVRRQEKTTTIEGDKRAARAADTVVVVVAGVRLIALSHAPS